MPTPSREPMLELLRTMPEEAYSWFVIATAPSAMLKGANNQIWPDGIGGFLEQSRVAIEAVRAEADRYIAEVIAAGQASTLPKSSTP